jgi:hypothetical protein
MEIAATTLSTELALVSRHASPSAVSGRVWHDRCASPDVHELGNGVGSVKRLIGFVFVVLTASSVLSVAAARERELDRDTYALQYDFGTASNLVVEPRWQSAPKDVTAILKHIASHLVVGKLTFANIGEEWATADAVRVDLPRAQHLFSAYSDKVAASVFLIGGSGVKVYAVLARRHAQNYCIFKLPELGLSSLTISTVQYELRPDRDQTATKIPKCQSQSLARGLELPDGL